MKNYTILPNNYILYTCMSRDFYNALEFANIEHRTICKWDTERCSETTRKAIENDVYSNIENEYFIVNDNKKSLLEECLVTDYSLGSGQFGHVMTGFLHLDSNARIQRIEHERQWALKSTENNKENETAYYDKYHRFHNAPNSYQLAYGGGWIEVAVKVFDFVGCVTTDDCIRKINEISREAYLVNYLQRMYRSMTSLPSPPPTSPSPSPSRSLPPSASEHICASEVVQVYKTWYDDTKHLIYMALTKGDLTLGSYAELREFQFTPFELISLMEQCLRGVHFMHHCQIVHCDIKPENIILLMPPQSNPQTPTSSLLKETKQLQNTPAINTNINNNNNNTVRETSRERSTSQSSQYSNNINGRYHQLMPRVLFTDFGLSQVVSDLVCSQLRKFGTPSFMPPECFSFYKSESATTNNNNNNNNKEEKKKKKKSNITLSENKNETTDEEESNCKASYLTANDFFARDVWSLGCVFYYLLTGKYGFRGNSMSAIQEQVTQGIQSITTFTEEKMKNKEHTLYKIEQKEQECCRNTTTMVSTKQHNTKNRKLHLSSTKEVKSQMPWSEVHNQSSEYNHQSNIIIGNGETCLQINKKQEKEKEEEEEEIALQFVKQLILSMLTMEVSHRPSAAYLINEIQNYKYKFVAQRSRFTSLIYNWVRFPPEFIRMCVCQSYFLVPIFSQPVVQNDTFTSVELDYDESVIVRRELVTYILPTDSSHYNNESNCVRVSMTIGSEEMPLASPTTQEIRWYEILYPIHGYCMKFMNGMNVFEPFELPTVNSLESSKSSVELLISPTESVEKSKRDASTCKNNNNCYVGDDDNRLSTKKAVLSPIEQEMPDVNINAEM